MISAARIDAIAERVYYAQQRRGGMRFPVLWSRLTAAEKWPWRDGAKIYLRAARVLGWRPPAKSRKRR